MALTRPPWERMIARPFSFPCEIASPIAPRTPDDSIEEKPIKKVERFIKEAFGQEMIENDIVDSLKESEQNVSFQGHIF